MDITYLIAFVSISAAAVSFCLGVVVLIRNVYNSLNFNFCLFAWAVTMWSMLSYAFFVNHNNFTLYKFVAAFGGVCLLLIAPWVLYLVKLKPNKILLSVLYTMSLFVVTVPFWDKWAMTNFTYHEAGFSYQNGGTYYLYAIVVFFTIGYTFYVLAENFFKSSGVQKKLTGLVILGMTIFMCTDLAFGVILPYYGITPLIPYVNIGAAVFVSLSAYAIIKFLPVELLSSKI